MAEFTAEDLEFGREIATRLSFRSGRHAYYPGIPVEDVQLSYESFDEDLELLGAMDFDGMVPALAFDGLDEPVPVALSDVLPNWAWGPTRERFSRFRRSVLNWLDFSPRRSLVSVAQARRAMTKFAAEFLAARRAGIRELRDDPGVTSIALATATTPGCAFEVHTVSQGLRVHWSGAYRISSNYFGSPTTPARSLLQSGIYIFGVDGGAYTQVTWDTSAKVTLPGPNTSVSLNY